ncbi:MAG: teichoic acid transporter [Sulfolobaceae archaeon]|nr:teichoic acid transporter [Sulfolobaceae archaeon]
MPEKPETHFTRVGIINLFYRVLSAPISFIFTFLVARYLSSPPYGVTYFATWQTIFVFATGYFVIPADLFSLITSRYAAEKMNVGGIIIMNIISGSIAGLIFALLVPYYMTLTSLHVPIYFYASISIIALTYVMRTTSAITTGKTPKVVGLSAFLFQIVRLLVGLLLMFVFNLSILAVILAYDLGYLTQILTNMFYIRSNLRVDFNVAFKAVRKSVVFLANYLQYILEASIVWIALAITFSDRVVAYFESAIIISNIVLWSQAAYSGLILRLSESRDPEAITTALKLYSLAGSLFLLLVGVDGLGLLYKLRPEYVEGVYAMYVLSFSNYLRGFYQIFYQGITMADSTLSVYSKDEFKGYTAKLTILNSLMSGIGIAVSTVLIYFFRYLPPRYIALLMTIGIIVNSVTMIVNSYNLSSKIYKFKVPKKEILVPLITAILLVAIFPRPTSYLGMIIYGLLAFSAFALINLIFNRYARSLVSAALKELIG